MPKRRRTLEHRGLSDSDYMSIMEKVANENYTNWGFNNPDEALLYALNDKTYNYRGYYDKYPKGKGNAIDHWTDEFKTVYHPTFSNESKYSGKVDSNFNPNGFTGGMWLNDIYIPPKYQSTSKLKFENGGRLQFRGGGKKPITTGGAGYIPNNLINGIKFNPKKVYNRVPGDSWYNFINENRLYNDGTADAIGGVKNYLFNDDDYVEKRLARYTPYKNITYREADEAGNKVSEEIRKVRSRINKLPERKRKYLEKLQDKADALTVLQHEDAKDVYLGMPQRTGTLKPAEYFPTQGVLNNGMYVTYMREPSFIEDVIIPTYNNYQTRKVNKEGKKLLGEVISFPKNVSNVHTITPKGNAVVTLPFLSNATMSKGYDKKGEYVSIFDTWDYNTDLFATPGDNVGSSIKGKPFDIYDRYYLDDIYGVKEPTHAKYLPEITVEAKRKKKSYGGTIHIAPSKKGTFTAAASKHGMGV